ncbi:hypothetical protein Pmani_040132 [Petrolisthes manimaculis]|uniref:Uncharacterized protein n=1 Tax=Petrolisthes manimaculis TaxID=1843537 RepID=A0AAE1NBH4_9EUCA|nr:hypothetical protein Pmani_040132 [Petrolisthes manimaculis]
MVKRDEEGRKMGETERGGREREKKWDGRRWERGIVRELLTSLNSILTVFVRGLSCEEPGWMRRCNSASEDKLAPTQISLKFKLPEDINSLLGQVAMIIRTTL